MRTTGLFISIHLPVFVTVSIFFCAGNLFAQRTLTLEECIGIALENSYDAKIAKQSLRSSEASANAARKALYSSVDMSFDTPQYYRRLTSAFNTTTGLTEYYPIESTQWTTSLDINQPIIWTNSTFTVSGSLYRQDQTGSALSGGYFRDYYTNLSIIFRQPLFVPNSLGNSLRRAELDYEEAIADYTRSTLDLVYQVTESFYNVYSSQQQAQIQRDRVKQQEESFSTAQRKYNSGLIAEVEAMQFEVDLATAQNDLLSAENTNLSTENGFKLLIGMPLDTDMELALTDTTFRSFAIDVEKAIAEAKRTLTDFQRAKNNVERSQISLDETKAEGRIRGDLTVSYGFSNDNEQIDKLFIDPRNTRGAQLTISVPVFDWGRHSEQVQGAEAQLQTAKLNAERTEIRIEQEIRNLVRQIESSARRVVVLQQSLIVAEKANDISTKRFEVGTIGATELAQSQSRLLQARLSALQALIDYNTALADLTRKTSYDFEIDAPVRMQP